MLLEDKRTVLVEQAKFYYEEYIKTQAKIDFIDELLDEEKTTLEITTMDE